jgi:hypothetical protein
MGRQSSENRLNRVKTDRLSHLEGSEFEEPILELDELEQPELTEFAYMTGPKPLTEKHFEWDDLPSWEPMLNGRQPDWK